MTETLSPIGFWSYARQDDEEKLSGLRSILQRQLQQKYGREPIKIFQDVAAIPPGADWNNKITEALHSSTFLIPIITPNFLESEWCNQEFFLFLEREQAIAAQFPELAASKRVFPIFYIDITDVEAFDSRLLPELRKRQWTNFRDLIFKDEKHESVRLRLDQIADGIVKVLRVDQRVARERRNAAAARALELQAEEEAAAERKKREEQAARAIEEARQEEARERELAVQRVREEEARQAKAREDAERKAREAAAEAKQRAEQTAREESARSAKEAEEKRHQEAAQRQAQELAAQREEAARKAHEEGQRQQQAQQTPAFPASQTDVQPAHTQFWQSPKAITSGVVLVLLIVIFMVFSHSSDVPVQNAGQPAPTSVNAPPQPPSAYDQARTYMAANDYAHAVPLLDQACNSAVPEACVDLGMLYQKGTYVTADVSRAGQLFQQACTAGDQSGCTQLKSLQAVMAALNGSGNATAAERARREAAVRKALEQ